MFSSHRIYFLSHIHTFWYQILLMQLYFYYLSIVHLQMNKVEISSAESLEQWVGDMKTDPFLPVGKTVNSVIALPPQYCVLSRSFRAQCFCSALCHFQPSGIHCFNFCVSSLPVAELWPHTFPKEAECSIVLYQSIACGEWGRNMCKAQE